jgi:hypothetical protein
MNKKQVIDFFGTQEKTANFIGKSRVCVTMWKDPIPVKWALFFDQATQGQLEFDKKMYQNPRTPVR